MDLRHFRVGHPRGFYISGARAYPFNWYFGRLGRDRASPPPRFHHERVFVYDGRSAPWLSARDETEMYRACADVAARYAVRWDWARDGPFGVDVTAGFDEPDEEDPPAVFRDFAGYYETLASIRRPRPL
jgi:hypothetical protein